MSKTFSQLKEETLPVYVEQELEEAFQASYAALEEQTYHMEDTAPEPSDQYTIEEAGGISVTLIISVLLATPSVIKGLTKAVDWIVKKIMKLFGRDDDEDTIVAQKVLEFADKWHHAYIKIIEKTLKLAGIYKTVGIEDEKRQEKAAEVVFYTIIFGFAVHGGYMSIKSISGMVKHSSLSHIDIASLESVLTAIKSKEVSDFVQEIT